MHFLLLAFASLPMIQGMSNYGRQNYGMTDFKRDDNSTDPDVDACPPQAYFQLHEMPMAWVTAEDDNSNNKMLAKRIPKVQRCGPLMVRAMNTPQQRRPVGAKSGEFHVPVGTRVRFGWAFNNLVEIIRVHKRKDDGTYESEELHNMLYYGEGGEWGEVTYEPEEEIEENIYFELQFMEDESAGKFSGQLGGYVYLKTDPDPGMDPKNWGQGSSKDSR